MRATAWGASSLDALAYAAVAAVAVWASARVCRTIVPFDDGPRPGRPPITALIAAAAAIGFALPARGVPGTSLALYAVLTAALAACWYSDVRCGILPDVFTLAPLAIVLAAAASSHNAAPLLSAAIVGVPFAFAAFASRGRGMGWGDVKLVALGAAVLGWQTSLLAFAVACLLAAGVAALRGRCRAPIAFAPYLVASIAVALTVPGF
ncbi:MAG: prepilin peptidase [Candidatus Eremiobacteraeota bacterium]|nr:prepilin peptidase [Candidatus Eremiobacteraeota bacterium]MBC5801582.1 prepilin peptidase [Candidatus Eremiobacteraeota bacterium]MBC5821703.1 prepilin peptidase [Candidatus Eremiobacteraeota bacterium]